MNTKREALILIGMHKPYPLPDDSGYLPIHLGSSVSKFSIERAVRDDTGNNISFLNPYFCELTGLYWAWKNTSAEIYGSVQYRRYFYGKKLELAGKSIASAQELLTHMAKYDIIVPKLRRYVIETVWSQYANAHLEEDVRVAREIVSDLHPDSVASFDMVFQGRSLSLFNMFVMRREAFNHYLSWLFPILFHACARIDYLSYDQYQRRVFGFLAERLFNVWIHQWLNKYRVMHLPVVHLEPNQTVARAIKMVGRKLHVARR